MGNLNFSNIKTGDCLLTSGSSWLASAIKKFTKCKYNHAGMFIWIQEDLYIAEMDRRVKTSGAGLILTPFEDYATSKKKLLVKSPIFTFDEKILRHVVTDNIGRFKYSYFNLIIAQPILQLTGKWIGFNKENHMVCSAFVSWVYNKVRPDMKAFENWPEKDPEDLFKDCVNFVEVMKIN